MAVVGEDLVEEVVVIEAVVVVEVVLVEEVRNFFLLFQNKHKTYIHRNASYVFAVLSLYYAIVMPSIFIIWKILTIFVDPVIYTQEEYMFIVSWT